MVLFLEDSAGSFGDSAGSFGDSACLSLDMEYRGGLMILKKRNFLRILTLELEDMRQDIELEIQATEKTLCEANIAPHVFRENLALLNNKLLAVRDFEQILSTVRAEDYAALDELADSVLNSFKSQVDFRGWVYSTGLTIERKINKVKKYILQKE